MSRANGSKGWFLFDVFSFNTVQTVLEKQRDSSQIHGMYSWIRQIPLVGALVLAGGLAFGTDRSALAETVFDAPFDPASCGERLNRLYDGDFEQFWAFVLRHGYSGVPEYGWSVPEKDGETAEDWRIRAQQCVLEVERANQRDDNADTRYALGYFLWFATPSMGFGDEVNGAPGIRERGYNMLRETAQRGHEDATEALIQVYMELVRLTDQQLALAGKNGTEVKLPSWWPNRDRVILVLDRMAKSGYATAYLAISAIYSERALLVGSTGHDHNGNAVSGPDPRLIDASRAYRQAWQDRVTRPDHGS